MSNATVEKDSLLFFKETLLYDSLPGVDREAIVVSEPYPYQDKNEYYNAFVEVGVTKESGYYYRGQFKYRRVDTLDSNLVATVIWDVYNSLTEIQTESVLDEESSKELYRYLIERLNVDHAFSTLLRGIDSYKAYHLSDDVAAYGRSIDIIDSAEAYVRQYKTPAGYEFPAVSGVLLINDISLLVDLGIFPAKAKEYQVCLLLGGTAKTNDVTQKNYLFQDRVFVKIEKEVSNGP